MKLSIRSTAAAGLILAVFGWAPGAGAQKITSGSQVPDAVVVRDVALKGDTVTGTVDNLSPRLVKEVKLLIRFVWHWRTEMTPGEDNPGRAVFHTIDGEIPPGGRNGFTYRVSPPLPARPDGWFGTVAEVVGFSEVGE